MTKKQRTYAPIICRACGTDHADKATRNEACKALDAEKRIAHLYHNGGSADEIREAQADREEALGNAEKAATFRAEAAGMREAHAQGRSYFAAV